MADKKIVNYIEKVTKKGFTLDQAKKKLEESHFPESKIKEAVSQVKRRKVWKASEIVFAIIIVIALLSVISDKLFEEEKVAEIPEPSDEDIVSEAMKNKNADACNKITDDTRREICEKMVSPPQQVVVEPDIEKQIVQEVIVLGDSSDCTSIEDDTRREICEKMSAPATTQTEPKTTPETEPESGMGEHAIMELAEQTNNLSLCNQIIDPTRRDICISMSS